MILHPANILMGRFEDAPPLAAQLGEGGYLNLKNHPYAESVRYAPSDNSTLNPNNWLIITK
jgi:hypothetical protein